MSVVPIRRDVSPHLYETSHTLGIVIPVLNGVSLLLAPDTNRSEKQMLAIAELGAFSLDRVIADLEQLQQSTKAQIHAHRVQP